MTRLRRANLELRTGRSRDPLIVERALVVVEYVDDGHRQTVHAGR